jgi:hypothetical protein
MILAREQRHATILDAAYWRDAFAHPETHPLLTLLLDLPTDVAIAALPIAAAAFPLFPCATTPLAAGTAPSAFASWKREGTHAFSLWSCKPVVRRTLSGGGGLGGTVGNYYHNILPAIRRPYALLWRDVRALLLPATAGRLNRGDAFAAAALNALDVIIGQQGFRDVLFMAEVQEQLAAGDRDTLLALLPSSRAMLTSVTYRLVRGPKRACWEGYLPTELPPIDSDKMDKRQAYGAHLQPSVPI